MVGHLIGAIIRHIADFQPPRPGCSHIDIIIAHAIANNRGPRRDCCHCRRTKARELHHGHICPGHCCGHSVARLALKRRKLRSGGQCCRTFLIQRRERVIRHNNFHSTPLPFRILLALNIPGGEAKPPPFLADGAEPPFLADGSLDSGRRGPYS